MSRMPRCTARPTTRQSRRRSGSATNHGLCRPNTRAVARCTHKTRPPSICKPAVRPRPHVLLRATISTLQTRLPWCKQRAPLCLTTTAPSPGAVHPRSSRRRRRRPCLYQPAVRPRSHVPRPHATISTLQTRVPRCKQQAPLCRTIIAPPLGAVHPRSGRRRRHPRRRRPCFRGARPHPEGPPIRAPHRPARGVPAVIVSSARWAPYPRQ